MEMATPATRSREVGQRARDYLSGNPLSNRELEVVRLIACDLGSVEISRRLGMTTQTVKNHITASLCKLGIRSRVGLAVWYVSAYGNPFRLD